MPTLNLKHHSAAPKKRQRLDKAGYRYYNTLNWVRLRDLKLSANPVCERCERALSECVHHITPFLNGNSENEINRMFNDWGNLMSLCNDCHAVIHQKKKNKMEIGLGCPRSENGYLV